MATNKTKTQEIVTIRLSAGNSGAKETLRTIASEKGVTLNALLNRLVANALLQHAKGSPTDPY